MGWRRRRFAPEARGAGAEGGRGSRRRDGPVFGPRSARGQASFARLPLTRGARDPFRVPN